MTVTYRPPVRVCRHTCPSTPIASTPSSRRRSAASPSAPCSSPARFNTPHEQCRSRGACEHALRLEHDLGNGPPHGRVRQTSALVGHMGQVVGPRAGACHTLVPSDPHQQVHGVLADGHVHEPPPPRGANPAHAPAFPAIPDGPVHRLAADQPHSGTRTRGHVPLRDGIQTQPIQAKQDPTIEHARLNTKPRGFIHFFQSHTESNRTAHTHQNAKSRLRPRAERLC